MVDSKENYKFDIGVKGFIKRVYKVWIIIKREGSPNPGFSLLHFS